MTVPQFSHNVALVGQVGNLQRIGNPPGVDPELLTDRLPIGRRLPTCPTKLVCDRLNKDLVAQAFLPVWILKQTVINWAARPDGSPEIPDRSPYDPGILRELHARSESQTRPASSKDRLPRRL